MRKRLKRWCENFATQKKWVEDYEEAESLTSDVEVLLDFFKEGEATADEVDQQYAQALHAIEALEFRNMLSDEGDAMSAVLQITAGAGGTESCDWASMLLRMYTMWCNNQKYKVKTLNFQEGDVAGIKTVTIWNWRWICFWLPQRREWCTSFGAHLTFW